MLSRFTDKNDYGGYTWKIELHSLFHIFIHGTDKNSFVVHFKEWKWIRYKTKFSFVSEQDLETTIIESFDRIFNYFQEHEEYSWTLQQKKNKLNQALELLNNH